MTIVFTRAWEDDRLDLAALAVRPGDRVLVVAGAGDAALALAAAGAQVIAVDRNPDQLRLVELKLAAARALPAERLHQWFEAGRDPAAPSLYRGMVRRFLSAPSAGWWDARIGVLATGLHRQWGVGRAFARFGSLARLVVPGIGPAIEAMTDPAEQADYWRRRVRPRLFGPLVHVLAARTPILAPLAPNGNELARMRASGWSRGLVDRIDTVVATTLIRAHPWWRPAFCHRVADLGGGAAWLDAGNAEALRAAAGGVRLVEGDLAEALSLEEAGSLSAVSVSNVPDWLSPEMEAGLARAVRHALAPGGRVLVRRVVSPVPGADAFIQAGLIPDSIANRLVDCERTALYEQVALFRRPPAGSAGPVAAF